MKKTLLVALLFATPVYAQHPAHPEVVSAVKDSLVAAHTDLSGCGAFEITKRVAWQLRGEGVGLLSKPTGNNCQGFSIDFVTYLDGSGVDILGDAGGANIPSWEAREPAGALLGRWEAPINPGDVEPTPNPTPNPTPTPVPTPPTELLQRVTTIEQVVADIRQQNLEHETAEAIERQKAQKFRDAVESSWERIGKPILSFVGKYVAPVAIAWIAAKNTGN